MTGIVRSSNIFANRTTVPLLPFRVGVEWTTLSAPDVLHWALVEYLEANTTAADVISLHYNVTEHDTQDTYEYTGTAECSDDYGSMTETLVQHEQRVYLENVAALEPFVQVYYAQAIQPYNGSMAILWVQIMFPEDDAAAETDHSTNENDEDIYSSAWFLLVVVLSAVSGVVVLTLLGSGWVKSRMHRWETRLNDWKYNLERERQMMTLPPPLVLTEEEALAVTTDPMTSMVP